MNTKTTVLISNKIYIKNPTLQIKKWCVNFLEFPNPEFVKNSNMGFSNWGVERKIILWERIGKKIAIPYGCYTKFFKAFPDLIPQFKPKENYKKINYNSKIELYDYQKCAVEKALKFPNGIIQMPCGSGKTQTALEIVAKLGMRTLWITHTHDLLQQSYNRAISCFNCPPKVFGKITNGKINIGEGITFATVQTLHKIDLEQYANFWDVIIVDECHHATGTPTRIQMFYKCLSKLYAKCVYGLSATPKRSDGLTLCTKALVGDIICKISEQTVASKKVPVYVYTDRISIYKPNLYKILNTDGTLNYAKFISDISQNKKRNEYICSVIKSINKANMSCLVLCDRVQHMENLQKSVNNSVVIKSKVKKSRKEILEKLNNKDILCVFATYQLAKEGLDIPSLDCVLFASPCKNETTIVQSCGRVSRKHENKKVGYIYDIVDCGTYSIFIRYANERRKIYKKQNYKML